MSDLSSSQVVPDKASDDAIGDTQPFEAKGELFIEELPAFETALLQGHEPEVGPGGP